MNPSQLQSQYTLLHSSQYWDWYANQDRWNANPQVYQALLSFADQVYEKLKEFLGTDPIQKTPDKRFYLLVNEETGGGFAVGYIAQIGKGPGIGVSWDAWTNQFAGNTYWSHELIAHETVNVFTGLVLSGWPVDWWANHRSPFPFMVKIKILEALGYTDGAQADTERSDTLTKMFLDLQTKYNWDLYRQLLKNIADDGWTTWDTLAENGGSNPSILRSSYVAAYLSTAVNTNLTDVINTAYAATEHLDYRLDAQVVQQIINKRNDLQTLPRDNDQWNNFRKGIF